jgi:hypothetical protein
MRARTCGAKGEQSAERPTTYEVMLVLNCSRSLRMNWSKSVTMLHLNARQAVLLNQDKQFFAGSRGRIATTRQIANTTSADALWLPKLSRQPRRRR